MRTTTHTPDLGTTFTFPVESTQHQLSILTLVTHMFLSLPILNTPLLSWNIIRYTSTHRQTMHLILATITLKRYHHIWFTSNPTPNSAIPIDWVLPLIITKPAAIVPPIHLLFRPIPSSQYTRNTSQMILSQLLYNRKNK